MFKRLVAIFLVVTLSVAIDDKFFDKSHIPVSPLSSGKHIAGTVVAFHKNEYQRYAIQRLIELDKLEQYQCLYELWMRESNWRPKAKNKKSSAMGIPQLLDSTWKNIGVKPTKDGFKQVDAGLLYIDRKFGKNGGICRAYAHHLAKGWY